MWLSKSKSNSVSIVGVFECQMLLKNVGLLHNSSRRGFSETVWWMVAETKGLGVRFIGFWDSVKNGWRPQPSNVTVLRSSSSWFWACSLFNPFLLRSTQISGFLFSYVQLVVKSSAVFETTNISLLKIKIVFVSIWKRGIRSFWKFMLGQVCKKGRVGGHGLKKSTGPPGLGRTGKGFFWSSKSRCFTCVVNWILGWNKKIRRYW